MAIRAILVKVVNPTPQASTLTLALCSVVVRVPLLTFETLADGIASVVLVLLESLNTLVVFKAQKPHLSVTVAGITHFQGRLLLF